MKRVALILVVGLCFFSSSVGAAECRRTEVLRLKNSASSSGTVPLWKLQRPQETAFFLRSGMSIDADGAPQAYHPVSDQGLDALGNADKPGNWWAVVADIYGWFTEGFDTTDLQEAKALLDALR